MDSILTWMSTESTNPSPCEICLSPTPPPRGRGYNNEYHLVTPFSPGRRGLGGRGKKGTDLGLGGFQRIGKV
jgi:hypothetical protein